MAKIFLAQNCFAGWNSPVDPEVRVENADACIGFRVVEIIAFILENGDVAEHREPVSETAGNEQLTVILFGQLDCHMLAVGW